MGKKVFREAQAANFAEWRAAARDLIREGVEPSEVSWNGEGLATPSLDLGWPSGRPEASSASLVVPKEFLVRAERVACHNAADTWDLLYRLLWRLCVKGEKNLLSRMNVEDVSQFFLREKEIRRERHKMTAFVRFKKIQTETGSSPRETYAAWYEPTHDVVRLAAPFFRDRFGTMDWSILTPRTCVSWNGEKLLFSQNGQRSRVPEGDDLEMYWKSYYASIFNPARLNISMMEREMPRRYWKNLPEAELISELANNSYGRTQSMQDHVEDKPEARERRPAGAPEGRDEVSCRSPDEIRLRVEGRPFEELGELARGCRACGLCENATQTVWGEGPSNARLMVVGEQPGDQEDLAGRPFVGPAGQLLDRAMERAGLDRSEVYVTNAVKHFKWRPSGKRRLHQRPEAREIRACSPWLEAELRAVRPSVVLCLGATAARAALGRAVSVAKERGLIDDPGRSFQLVLSYHPSYLLRLEDERTREEAEAAFHADLALAAELESMEG